jgi:hypothetical protein
MLGLILLATNYKQTAMVVYIPDHTIYQCFYGDADDRGTGQVF